MDFVVEKRKLDMAMEKIAEFLESNGIKNKKIHILILNY